MTHDREEGKQGNSQGNNVHSAIGLDVTPQRNDGLMIWKFQYGLRSFAAWYLTPSLRFGVFDNGGGFLGLSFLKFDACLTWQPKAD
jgi:hypothetical protein